jgi:hypothetical protein
MLSTSELRDLELHDLPHHHRHRLAQHVRVLRREHALNRFTGSHTSTFGHRGVSFSSNFAGTTIMSAAVAGHIPGPRDELHHNYRLNPRTDGFALGDRQ